MKKYIKARKRFDVSLCIFLNKKLAYLVIEKKMLSFSKI